MNAERRRFCLHVAGITLVAATPALRAEDKEKNAPPRPATPVLAERVRTSKQDPDLVFEFVRAGHTNLARVKELTAAHPSLVRASWDWGDGDWETALGGASHVGNRAVARFLLEHGARMDAFCAAMLGQTDVVLALLRATPSVATTHGPHGYTLLYHAAISGQLAMAEALKPLLPPDGRDYTQALSAAVRDGHLEMTRWLFANGPVDPNVVDGVGKRPLAVAQEKGFHEIAEELRRRGARS